MKQQFDIKFAAREYTTADGQQKTYWSQHGTMWIDDEKKSVTIKIDSLPVSKNFDGFLKAWPTPIKDQQQRKPRYEGLPVDEDEDLPF